MAREPFKTQFETPTPGGQAQFLERPVPLREGVEIAPLLDRVRGDLTSDWSLDRMAGEARMSVRTFLRRFSEATGQTPGDWLAFERVNEAKRLLCEGNGGMEYIALAVGFGNSHTLRHHFRQKVGLRAQSKRISGALHERDCRRAGIFGLTYMCRAAPELSGNIARDPPRN